MMRVDWNNPLTDHFLNDGLIGYWLSGHDGDGEYSRNIAARRKQEIGPNITITGNDNDADEPADGSGNAAGWTYKLKPRFPFPSPYFDGTSDSKFTIPQDTTFNPVSMARNNGFSMFCWIFKPSGTTAAHEGIMVHGTTGWSLKAVEFGDYQLHFNSAFTAAVLAGNTVMEENKPYYVGFTLTEDATATLNLYVNGKNDGSTTTTRNFNNSANHAIGVGRSTDGAEPFDGNISSVRFYRRALSDSAAMLLYQDALQGHADTLNYRESFSGRVPVASTFQPAWARQATTIAGTV